MILRVRVKSSKVVRFGVVEVVGLVVGVLVVLGGLCHGSGIRVINHGGWSGS